MTSCGNMNQVLSAIQNGSVVNAIASVIGLDKVSAANLIGSWSYRGPGCAFTSENLLAKAGGEVAAAQIEQKLLPYYQQVNISAATHSSPSIRTAPSPRRSPVHHSAAPTPSTSLRSRSS